MKKSVSLLQRFLPLLVLGIVQAQIYVGYYDIVCPLTEHIVRTYVEEAVLENPGLAAGILHMHFHDCFVRGCDGSILLDTVPGSTVLAEKDSPANKISFRGGEVVDKAKARLEELCPGKVSCADILAFAARDSVNIVGGPYWPVPAGRRDGTVSLASEVVPNLAAPTFDVPQLTKVFARKGLSQEDMVTLSGAHTIGQAHCLSFVQRLYNFSRTSAQDPSLDPKLASWLRSRCPNLVNLNSSTVVAIDSLTPNVFDNKYYVGLQEGRGLFSSDVFLLQDTETSRSVVRNGMDGEEWFHSFANSMIRMSSIDVKTGGEGEIRRNCHAVN